MSGKHSFRAFERAEEVRAEEKEPEENSVEMPDEKLDDTSAQEEQAPKDEADAEEEPDDAEPEKDVEPEKADKPRRQTSRSRVAVFVLLPALALLLAAGSAFLKWQIASDHGSATARTESAEAAKDITIQMLSYEPDTVEQHLNSVRDRLTGDFLGTYTTLINTAVIPGATAQRITAVAEVPAIGSVSASTNHAEVMLYLNQFVTIGDQAPQKTPSVVRATMVREDGRWLMSQFEPVKP